MTKRWLGQAAVRLYPAEIRGARGDELVGTLLDAGDASLTAFITELVSLILGALKAQSRRALGVPIRTLVYELLCWGAVVTVAKAVVGEVSAHIRWGGSLGSLTTVVTLYVLPALFLAAFTARRPRLAGLLGLLWVAAELHMHQPRFYLTELFLRGAIEQFLLPVVGSLLMITVPRRAPASANWLWLLPAAIWAAFELTLLGAHSGVGRVAPVLVILLLSPFEPALVLGTALSWTILVSVYVAPNGPSLTIVELLCCAPAALLLVALCRRLSTRPHRP